MSIQPIPQEQITEHLKIKLMELALTIKTTESDNLCALVVAQFDSLTSTVKMLEAKLNPLLWGTEESHAWHTNIPDVHKAFEELRNA